MQDGEEDAYFAAYGTFSPHATMLSDSVRTRAYQEAILANKSAFAGKTVLDFGTGSGLLAILAAAAGARKVYAVDASESCAIAKKLVQANGFEETIDVIHARIQDVTLPEQVDVVMSECMGVLLVGERMVEQFIACRRWLKKDGIMFPSRAAVHLALYSDPVAHALKFEEANFWAETRLYEDPTVGFPGIDLSSLRDDALVAASRCPSRHHYDVGGVVGNVCSWDVDLSSCAERDVAAGRISFEHRAREETVVHGLIGWFSVEFVGPEATVCLRTGPGDAPTHWQQVGFFFPKPMHVESDAVLRACLAWEPSTSLAHSVDVVVEGPSGVLAHVQAERLFGRTLRGPTEGKFFWP